MIENVNVLHFQEIRNADKPIPTSIFGNDNRIGRRAVFCSGVRDGTGQFRCSE
jgi:hypothetical protein